MNIGDITKFGGYNWRILEIQQDRILLVTQHIIELRDYHDNATEITWKDCELRRYLNTEFYERLSTSEQEKIIEVINQNPGNKWYTSEGGGDTSDKVFILSIDDVVRYYFGDSSHLLDNPSKKQRYWFQRKDANNIKRRAEYLNSLWWWWIRTPGKNNRFAIYIHGDGNVGIQGNGIGKRNTNIIHHLTSDNRGGVRPAVWVVNQVGK